MKENTLAYAAADAAFAATSAATYDADAAPAAYAADTAYAAAYAASAAYAARQESLKASADICRQYLTEEVLTAYKKLR